MWFIMGATTGQSVVDVSRTVSMIAFQIPATASTITVVLVASVKSGAIAVFSSCLAYVLLRLEWRQGQCGCSMNVNDQSVMDV